MIEVLIFALAAAALSLGVIYFLAPEALRYDRLRRRFAGLKPGHWLPGLAFLALLLAMLMTREPGVLFTMAMMAMAFVLALRAWRDEFLFVMERRDDEFPGAHDRLIWIALLVALPPIGTWFFRSYRLRHWSEKDAMIYDEVLHPGTTAPEVS